MEDKKEETVATQYDLLNPKVFLKESTSNKIWHIIAIIFFGFGLLVTGVWDAAMSLFK